MPKTKISEYSATANSNTDVASINIDEGCAPSGINNAIRAVMGHLKDFQQGTNGDPFNGPVNGTLGATTPSTGAFTTLSASSTVTLSGGTANGVAYLNDSKVLTTGSALVFDATNLSLGTVGAKVNFATTGSATVNYVGGSADGYSLEMVMQRGASQPLKYKQDYGVGHVWSVAGSDKLTLDASGNLLVGTTTNTTNANLILTGATRWAVGTQGGGNIFYIVRDSDSVGQYMVQGSTSWTATSDERLKDIIEPITDAASKVSTLRAVIGKFKKDAEGTRRSFLIAQDVQAVLPESVTVQEDEFGTLGIQYTEVIPLLVAAIQEQQALIVSMREEIEALKIKVGA